MNDTVFGKIILGDIPATKVYEDDMFLAFLDINPTTKGHTLLIPKEQYIWIQDAPDDVIAATFIKAKEIIQAMRKGLPCDYVQLTVIGNEVPHFHVHLIPRSLGESTATRPHLIYENLQEMEVYAARIKKSL